MASRSFGSSLGSRQREFSLFEKLLHFNWGLLLLISVIASIGFAAQYSAAGGNLDPWAGKQMIRFAVGVVLMLAVALTPLSFWYRFAYPIYALAFALLIAVAVAGRIGMGAQRWLDLGLFQVQPSEPMKIGLVLVLARYFHGLSIEEVVKLRWLIWPVIVAILPAALVAKQPDLGSAIILFSVTGVIAFLAGVRIRIFVIAGIGAAAIVPIAWNYLRDYQKKRIITFLSPETDPLGAGYHIIQSKIALGSGGIWGKGFLLGTQSHLQFLPEKQTDFIFTMFAEEFGLVGGIVLLALYALVLIYGTVIALSCRNQFGRLVAGGMISTFWLYAFINMAMVMGLLPVVGEPLPFVSYGGTALMTLLISFGMIINTYIHRDSTIGRPGRDFG